MPSFQRIEIMGHLGKDPETRFTPNGVPKTSFSVAVSDRWKDKTSQEWKEKTEWFNVIAWRKDWLDKQLSKGDLVFIAGKMETRSYDGRNGDKRYITELNADNILPLHGRKSGEQMPAAATAPAADTSEPLDDDVPF